MTSNNRKRAIRAYMAEYGVNYTTAMRRMDPNQPSCSLIAELRHRTGVMHIAGPRRSAKAHTAQIIAHELSVLGRRVLQLEWEAPVGIDPDDWDVIVVDDIRPVNSAGVDDTGELVAAAERGEILLIKVGEGEREVELPSEDGESWLPWSYDGVLSMKSAAAMYEAYRRAVDGPYKIQSEPTVLGYAYVIMEHEKIKRRVSVSEYDWGESRFGDLESAVEQAVYLNHRGGAEEDYWRHHFLEALAKND